VEPESQLAGYQPVTFKRANASADVSRFGGKATIVPAS